LKGCWKKTVDRLERRIDALFVSFFCELIEKSRKKAVKRPLKLIESLLLIMMLIRKILERLQRRKQSRHDDCGSSNALLYHSRNHKLMIIFRDVA
jgi:hypothetical protein